MTQRRRSIIGHHLILTMYGHWLPNDPRGSGSHKLFDEKFESLGPVHHGRQPEHLQPARDELREFHQRAESLLNFLVIWLDEAKRTQVGEMLGDVIGTQGYTCWACAVLSNHAHLLIRIHKDDAVTMWNHFAEGVRERLRFRFCEEIHALHPVISARPYRVYLYTPDDVRTRIDYVCRNPEREGLARQDYAFVRSYDGWPLHKTQR